MRIEPGEQGYKGPVLFPGNGQFPSRPCNRPGELITNCGTSCPKTCANLGQKMMCTMGCVTGCFCQLGLVRDYKGMWRRGGGSGENAPPVAQPVCKVTGEEYQLYGSPCPDTCANKDDNGHREEYTEDGSACPDTCANMDDRVGRICARISGCFCKIPLLRDHQGRCIHRDDCHKMLLDSWRSRTTKPPVAQSVCKVPGEEYVLHVSPCPDTCDNKNDKGHRPCPAILKGPGCSCKKPFVRDGHGRCVHPDDCNRQDVGTWHRGGRSRGNEPSVAQPVCKVPGEEYVLHVSPCPDTCANKDDNGYRACPAILNGPGCSCKKPLVRDDHGRCVYPDDCNRQERLPRENEAPVAQPVCNGTGEEYVLHVSPCPDTCANKDDKGHRACPLVLYGPGCSCKKPLVRDHQGRCIHPDYCNRVIVIGPDGGRPRTNEPPVAQHVCSGTGEEYQVYGSPCPDTCDNKDDNGRRGCPGVPFASGIFYTIFSIIHPWEHFTDCGTSCPKTCANMGVEMMCTMQCVSGCFCQPGMVRSYRGRCILPGLCNLPI
ncbi:unnamed protein product [Medioppia subpectinata]|uniref:TIL domain-containing protein n=1 Tax=Medioppia subpectinata TaxID=1979941 RepID=A0A7R9PYT8_9ACAR|nr:unnamed protein product [Medioppia subpectinata]CAG2106388.1 unnamed protein product [Medioppia subpectinata]